jgi:nucleolar protein 56
MSANVDYLLHESSVGYAILQVVHQADTIGNRLKEVQDASQDLARFGKMVKVVNFSPYRYAPKIYKLSGDLTRIQRCCRSS